MPQFLHVGCGPKRQHQTTRGFALAQWQEVRFDIDPTVAPDVIGSMTDLSAVATASMDALFSSHNIEHLYPHEVPTALAEFHRVLHPNGFAVITCPDLQSVCELVAQNKLLEPAYQSPAGPIAPLDILYGHRPAMAHGNLYMAHRCGFTEKVLLGTLEQAGFTSMVSMRRAHPFYDLWVLACRTPTSQDALRALALAHFPLPKKA
jgi:predicted SAM-dependent methyltransferase